MPRTSAAKVETNPTPITRLALLVIAFVAVCVGGCGGKASASFKGEQAVTIGTDGTVDVRRSSSSLTRAVNPPAASQPAVATADAGGGTGTSSGIIPPLPKVLTDYIGESLWVFYASGVGLIVLAVVGWKWLDFGLVGAAFVAAAAVGLFVAPSLIAALTPAVVLAVIGLLFVVGLTVSAGRWLKTKQERIATVDRALDLAEAGSTTQAFAAITTAPVMRQRIAKRTAKK